MSYVAFDRKYRPTNFKSVIGQKFVIQTLMNSIKLDKIAHAYIFAGPKGIGKTTIARILAKAVNCQSSKDGDACNVCDSCKLINENHTTDIVELDAASNNGVDDIRTILSGAMTLPMNLKKKVYIIDEAHMLSTSAWNALLKTLEEAPKHVIFIFATTEMYKIPPTILSRCQVYQFSKLTSKELKDIVINTSFKENIKITDESVDKIVNLSDGSGRDAYSVLEQMATYTNNNVNIEDINKVFGLLDVDRKIEILNLIIKSDISEIMIKLDKYEENGVNFTLLASDIIKILLDKLVYLQTNDSKLLKVLNDKTINNIDLDNDKLVALISIWNEYYMKIRQSGDSRFYFESCIFKSLSLFTNTADVRPKEKTIEREPIEKTKDSINKTLPNIDDVCETKERKINLTKDDGGFSVVKNKQLEQSDIFNSIAFNNSSKYVNKAKEFLKKSQEIDAPSILQGVANATKPMIASNNGIVFIYEDEVDAELLSERTSKPEFLEQTKIFFDHPIYILGLTKQQLQEYGNKFMKLKKEGNVYDELDLQPLIEILKKKNNINQIWDEIFN